MTQVQSNKGMWHMSQRATGQTMPLVLPVVARSHWKPCGQYNSQYSVNRNRLTKQTVLRVLVAAHRLERAFVRQHSLCCMAAKGRAPAMPRELKRFVEPTMDR